MAAFLNHIYMLLWKNVKLQQRNKIRTVFELISPSFAFLILVIVRLSQDYYKVLQACQFKPTPLASKGPLTALKAFCYLGVCRQGEQSFGSEDGLFGDAEFTNISETMRNANKMLNNPVMQKLIGAVLTLPSNMSDPAETKKIPFHSLFSMNGSMLFDGVTATQAQRDGVMTAFVPFPKRWNVEVDSTMRLAVIGVAKTTQTVPNLFCKTKTNRPGWSDVHGLCQQQKFRDNIKTQFDLDAALRQMTSNATDKFTISIEARDATDGKILTSQIQQVQADASKLFQQISPPLMSLSVKEGSIAQSLSTIGRILCGKGVNNIGILAEEVRKIVAENSEEQLVEAEEKSERNASDAVNLTSILPPEKFCYDRRYHRAIFGPFVTMASTLNYPNIAELVFGIIPFYPDTPTTRQFLVKLNSTLQNLSSLSYLAEEYMNSFRPSLVNFISNSSRIEGIEVLLLTCEGLAPSSAPACRNALNFLELNSSSSTRPPSTAENSTGDLLNWKELLDRIDPIMYRLYYITACFRLNKLYGFNSLESVDNYTNFLIDEFEEYRQVNKPLFLASVLFDKQTSGFVKYRLRLLGAVVDSTRYFKVFNKGLVSIEPRKTFPIDFKYFTSFFIHIQELLEHGIQAAITGVDVPLQTYLNLFPSACYDLDTFVGVIKGFMPMIMTMSWIYNVSLLVNAIVYEKETRLKEMMKIMGLSDGVHWISWFITSFVIMALASILMTFVLKVGQIIVYSNPFILCFFIISFVVSTICESFLISIFFSDSSVASAFAGVIYFLGYIPYVAIVRFSGSMSRPHYLLSCLIPQLAFGLGCNFIGIWEQNSVGLQTANFYEKGLASEDFDFGLVILMLWIDSAIFMMLTWYLEKVFPGPYGVPKPWYFLCTRSFWFGSKQIPLQVDAGDGSSTNSNNSERSKSTGIGFKNESLTSAASANHSSDSSGIKFGRESFSGRNFEEEPSHLPVGIAIRNLSKVYEPGLFACKRNAKPFMAVDNLSYNFYEGQITSFLGHNGAGKSTTMSVLTGLYTPTSGTAYIAGYDIRTDMDEIRKYLGLCPQYNVLFDTLTVEDHIYFYGMLKGLSKAEVEPQIDDFIADVGLQKKRHEMSRNLSGGMKRKLSVAMAFVGGSKVVVLDEPTAGVDPHARRTIWDLLAKFRKGRTIVITTHHMDEADILGDRICIINKGRLVCSGSPMYLKKVFGEGYTLTMVKESINCDVKAAFSLVQTVVPEAVLGECTSSEINIKLPYKALPTLANLFVVLDAKLKNIHITSYGIEDSSLEEIFLAVTSFKPKENTTESEENIDVISIVPYRPSRRDSNFRIQQQQVAINDADAIPASSSPDEGSLSSSASIRLRKTHSPIWEQVKALWIKRMLVMRRSKLGFVAEFILPAVFILLALALLQISPLIGENPPMELAPWYMLGKPSQARMKDLFVFQSRGLFNFSDNVTLTDMSNRLMLHINNTHFIGTSCMRDNLVKNPSLLCKPERKYSSWSPAPSYLPSNTSWCQCSAKKSPNAAKCVDWPAPAQRVLMSPDKLESMQGYNITNYIQSTIMLYNKRRFGGYTMFVNDTQPPNPQKASASLEAAQFFKTISTLTGTRGRFMNLTLASLEISQQPERLTSLVNQIWFDNRGFVSGPAYLNILTNAVMRTLADKSLGSPEEIGVSGWTHPITSRSKLAADSIADNIYVSSITVVSIIFALSFIPASFILFLISEKTTNAKQLQFVSGVNPIVYWIVNHVWNLLNYLVPLTLLIFLFVIFKNYEFVGKETIGPFFMTMIMFGFACAPLMYPFSWVMTVPSKAFTILTCLNLGLGFVTTMSVTIVAHIGASNDDAVMTRTANILKVAFLPLPHFCLGQALMELIFYYQGVIVLGNYLKKNGIKPKSFKLTSAIEIHDSGWAATRRYILCMLAHSILYFILVLLMEYNCCCKQGLVSSRFYRIFYRAEYDKVMQPPNSADVDDDVRAETAKVEDSTNADHLLEMRHLAKIFSTSSGPKAAVKGISLGVKSHECFGFLGVNGAGKTTTFKMLTGDLVPTSGDALVSGFSILTEALEVHKQLGYCPQFDALLPLLTGRETLQLYARIRGVEEADIDELVETIAKRVGIEAHLDKTTQEYSGGNKRKLSCGIAFIGNPPIVFLDEPTAGMDPGARRFLWRCIQRMVAAGSCVILTTHSMEDCQALCHRLTIMVNGRLQCIGSPQHLKNKYGQGFTVFLRVRQDQTVATKADCAAGTGADFEAHFMSVHKAFQAIFPDSTLSESHASVLQYQLKQTEQLKDIFAGVQKLKDQNIILDYSVNQTTLDQVFINFAKKQK